MQENVELYIITESVDEQSKSN